MPCVLAYTEWSVTHMEPILCLCDLRKHVIMPITHDMRVYVRCRSAWRSQKRFCPQMMCGWHRLHQTGQQVALGSHNRTWVFAPCCTNRCAHKRRNMHAQSQLSLKNNVLEGPGSLHASCWKWCISLRREIKQLLKGEEYVNLTFSVPCVCNNRIAKTEATPGLKQISTHKSSQDRLCSCTRRITELMDCSQVFCSGAVASTWFAYAVLDQCVWWE